MSPLRVSIIGTGYVGAVTGICFTELGHSVIFIDIDQSVLDKIMSGKSPIYEPGLEELLQKNLDHISVTRDYSSAIANTDLTFICVGTPSGEDGMMDLKYIKSASRAIGVALKEKEDYHSVIVKSTVLPGTTEQIICPCIEKTSGKTCGIGFGIGMNPEFLREGEAVNDFFNPDRIIIGVSDLKTEQILVKIYSPIHSRKVTTSIKVAEMIKYASNAFLATKISFANEIGNLCKKLEIDSNDVFQAVGLDKRINPHFFRTGIGFGGSCFPKDLRALESFAKFHGIEPIILNAVIKTNENQPEKMIELLKRHTNIRGSRIGILGLAFKPDTDDVRESRAIPITRTLIDAGAQIIAYDPMAMNNFKKIFPMIDYMKSAEDVLEADVILIVTEWKEFENLNYQNKIVVDGRRINKARREAVIYEGVCW